MYDEVMPNITVVVTALYETLRVNDIRVRNENDPALMHY